MSQFFSRLLGKIFPRALEESGKKVLALSVLLVAEASIQHIPASCSRFVFETSTIFRHTDLLRTFFCTFCFYFMSYALVSDWQLRLCTHKQFSVHSQIHPSSSCESGLSWTYGLKTLIKTIFTDCVLLGNQRVQTYVAIGKFVFSALCLSDTCSSDNHFLQEWVLPQVPWVHTRDSRLFRDQQYGSKTVRVLAK